MTTKPDPGSAPSPRRRYRVVLRGRITDRMLAPYLDEFEIDRAELTTTLIGPIVDAAQLNGLITHLSSTGVDIIELTSDDRGGTRPR